LQRFHKMEDKSYNGFSALRFFINPDLMV